MHLTNWFVTLAVVVAAITFFSARPTGRITMERRLRRARGIRLLMLAAVAAWSALLIAAHTFFSLDTLPVLHAAPLTALAVATALAVLAIGWTWRATCLFRRRRLFGAP